MQHDTALHQSTLVFGLFNNLSFVYVLWLITRYGRSAASPGNVVGRTKLLRGNSGGPLSPSHVGSPWHSSVTFRLSALELLSSRCGMGLSPRRETIVQDMIDQGDGQQSTAMPRTGTRNTSDG